MQGRTAEAGATLLRPLSLSPAEERILAMRQAAAEAHQAALLNAAGRILARLGQALFGWIERARVRAALDAMTDRELADIGLTRGDLDRVIHGTEAEPRAAATRRPARPAGGALPHPA